MKNIFKCSSSKNTNCQLRDQFVPADRVVSTTTKRMYNVIVPPGSTYINCHSVNLIYLLTCNNCSLQYVGETVRSLSRRASEHRRCIDDYDK